MNITVDIKMKKFLLLLLFSLGTGLFGTAEAQLKKTIEQLIAPTEDTVNVQKSYYDSLRVDSMRRELEGAKSVEMELRMEIE